MTKHILPSEIRSAIPLGLETRDDNPSEIEAAIAAVAELRTAVTSTHTDIAAQIAAIVARLDAEEIRSQRPGAQAGNTDDVETRALNNFLRHGARDLEDTERRTLNLTTPSAGGYAVAPQYSTTIIEGVTQISPMRSLANVVQIGTGTNELWLPKVTAEADGGWVTETGSRSETQPTFDQQKIEVYEHAAIIPVSNQLLEDSFVDLSAYLAGHIAKRFARAESEAFTTGSGSGRPTGFLNTPSAFAQVETPQMSSPTYAAVIPYIIDLFYSLPEEYARNAVWQMTRQTMGLIRKLADSDNSNGVVWSDGLANGTPATLLGRPVRENPFMDNWTAGGSPDEDTFPVAFGDWNAGYTIVDRVNVEIMSDPYTGADNGITKIRARRRVGGEVTLAEAIVLLKATI
jgi:HK97 family phage major capsid protein